MRIKLDENVPARLVPLLTDLGHDVDTVIGEKLVPRELPGPPNCLAVVPNEDGSFSA